MTAFQTVRESFFYLVPVIWRYRKGYFFLQLGRVFVTALMPFINIIFPKLIIDELLGGHNVRLLLIYTAGITLGNAVLGIIYDILHETHNKYTDDFERFYSRLLAKKTLSMDFEHTENPAALEQLEKASSGIAWYSGGIDGLIQPMTEIIASTITLCGVVFLLLRGAPYIMILLIISVAANTWFGGRVNRKNLDSYKQLANDNRAFGYVLWELSDIRYGKDIRLYNAQDMMENKSKWFLKRQISKWRFNARDIAKDNTAISTIGGIRDVIMFFYIGYLALLRLITIGDFTMYISSSNTFGDSLTGIVGNIQNIVKNSHYTYEFVKFMRYPSAKIIGTKVLPAAQDGMRTIRFEHVAFHYPRTEIDILKDITLTIRPGEHLSVVGLNGAGKTTFIKLLCRLYDPTEGTIYIDDVDIKNLDYDTYIKELAVVFQDFTIFSFQLKENIALGDSNKAKKESLNHILELIGMKADIDRLPNGMETYINKQFEEAGTELSGGQQQKLAIARALYKDAPIVILDEPTAALDPVAEYDIYRQFNSLIGGKSAIYISHRLSSCKFCDKIAVFSDGRIAEYGTHEELAAIPEGIYREMFYAQAQYYQ
jgi:ABC-type multidrug transport system fused ATPase/permease subunit